MISISGRIKKIMEHYGYERQREQFAEECAEGILAVQKCKRTHDIQGTQEAFENLKEEVADVLIMASQMYLFLGDEDIDRIINSKIERQIERIEADAEDRAVP